MQPLLTRVRWGRTTLIYQDDIGRFESYVTKQEGCWEWSGPTTQGDRPYFTFGGGRTYGSIFSYLLHKGDIADGLIVRHTCDNPSCMNPEHLILGTQGQNMKDMKERGRTNSDMSQSRRIENAVKAWATRKERYGYSGGNR